MNLNMSENKTDLRTQEQRYRAVIFFFFPSPIPNSLTYVTGDLIAVS